MLVAMFPPVHEEASQSIVLTLSVLAGVFYLYVIGILLSSVAFAGELIWVRYQFENQKKLIRQ